MRFSLILSSGRGVRKRVRVARRSGGRRKGDGTCGRGVGVVIVIVKRIVAFVSVSIMIVVSMVDDRVRVGAVWISFQRCHIVDFGEKDDVRGQIRTEAQD